MTDFKRKKLDTGREVFLTEFKKKNWTQVEKYLKQVEENTFDTGQKKYLTHHDDIMVTNKDVDRKIVSCYCSGTSGNSDPSLYYTEIAAVNLLVYPLPIAMPRS